MKRPQVKISLPGKIFIHGQVTFKIQRRPLFPQVTASKIIRGFQLGPLLQEIKVIPLGRIIAHLDAIRGLDKTVKREILRENRPAHQCRHNQKHFREMLFHFIHRAGACLKYRSAKISSVNPAS